MAPRPLLEFYWSWRYRTAQRDKTIHQLAARKVLGELKDGTSYLHNECKSDAVDKGLDELVKQEAVRVGLKYAVTSEWTSFVAIVKREGERGLDKKERGGV